MPETPKPDLSAALAAWALGEATPEEEAAVHERMSRDLAFAEECDRLKATDRDLRAAAQAATESGSPMPASIRARLDAERRALFAGRQTAAPATWNVITPNTLPANDEPAPAHPGRRPNRAWIGWAAALAIIAAAAAFFLQPPKPRPSIAGRSPRLLAPAGVTARTEPMIVWENAADPAQQYDVWVLPPDGPFEHAPAIYQAKGVRSPLPFDRLQPQPSSTPTAGGLEPGKNYRLLVCPAGAGRIAGTAVPFSTSTAATAAAPAPSVPDTTAAIAQARYLLQSGQPGDALMLLAALPEAERALPEVRDLMDEIKASLAPPSRRNAGS